MSMHQEIKAWLEDISVGMIGDVQYVTRQNLIFLDLHANSQYLMATLGYFRLPAANQPQLSRVVLHATPPLQQHAVYEVLLSLGGILRMVLSMSSWR